MIDSRLRALIVIGINAEILIFFETSDLDPDSLQCDEMKCLHRPTLRPSCYSLTMSTHNFST